MTRKVLWPILVIGILLIVMPFAISLPSKASAGQTMLNEFHPIMQPASVRTTVNYDVNTFTPLGPFAVGGVAAAAEVPKFIGTLATDLHATPAQVEAQLASSSPVLSGIFTNLGKLEPIFKNVPPGLAWYKPIVDTMQAQVNNFAAVDALPNFNIFTWAFVVPGALLVLCAGYGLVLGRKRA